MVRTPVVGVFGAPSQLGDSWVTGLSSFTEDKVNGGFMKQVVLDAREGSGIQS